MGDPIYIHFMKRLHLNVILKSLKQSENATKESRATYGCLGNCEQSEQLHTKREVT
jgi:hypothetical protein